MVGFDSVFVLLDWRAAFGVPCLLIECVICGALLNLDCCSLFVCFVVGFVDFLGLGI